MDRRRGPITACRGIGVLHPRKLRIRRIHAALGCVVLAASCLLSLTVSGSAQVSAAPTVSDDNDHARHHDVIANLFEWNWPSVAKECATVLGPAGYGGVQVAPPQDSYSRTSPAPIHPWWEVYQPIDYHLTSRMGNEVQFKAMVSACRRAGVKVFVDAVINHMTGGGGTSYGGVTVTKYGYPGLYSFDNFHHYPADCPTPDGNIDDFNNYLQVTKCELVSLSDLRTETTYVRDTLAGYLNKLISYGVSGFRVDAAKHIGQADLAAIESRLHPTLDGTRPYIALEVPPGGPGKLATQAFEAEGSLLGFDFASQVESAFKSYTQTPIPGGNITDLKVFGEASGLIPSDKSLAFVQNHDTERNGSTLSYKDGATNIIATEFMLAAGYGRPEVYAGFAFTNSDDSPPANANGFITNTDCDNGAWVCNDRVTGVANMVGWHNYVGDQPTQNWYDDGVNLIAFSRGNRGWIAINNATTAGSHAFATGLTRGTYCDIIHGSVSHGHCTGPTVHVGAGGMATVTVAAKDSVAFDRADRLS